MTVHMNDIVILKAANHVHDCRNLPDMTQELVSQSFSFGRTFHQACNVAEFDGGVNGLLRIINIVQHLQSLIRNRHHAHVRLDGAERIVRRFRTGLRNRIEQRTFTHVWETHNT